MEGGEITLEKLDAVRRRTGARYGDCLEALRANGGDVCGALAELEDSGKLEGRTVLGAVGRTAGRLWDEGMRTRLAVRRGEHTVLSVPAAVGVASAVLFPFATAVGVGAALASNAALSLEWPDATS